MGSGWNPPLQTPLTSAADRPIQTRGWIPADPVSAMWGPDRPPGRRQRRRPLLQRGVPRRALQHRRHRRLARSHRRLLPRRPTRRTVWREPLAGGPQKRISTISAGHGQRPEYFRVYVECEDTRRQVANVEAGCSKMEPHFSRVVLQRSVLSRLLLQAVRLRASG